MSQTAVLSEIGVSISLENCQPKAMHSGCNGSVDQILQQAEYLNLPKRQRQHTRHDEKVGRRRKANAVEHMIVDAFVEADPFFKLADATEDAQAFALLDDSILKVCRAYAACWHPMLHSAAEAAAYRGR